MDFDFVNFFIGLLIGLGLGAVVSIIAISLAMVAN